MNFDWKFDYGEKQRCVFSSSVHPKF